jgi:16S rRNA C967 or C1407 C5-methylase (RsmB/RsmF family)
MLPALLLGPFGPRMAVLDLCAAPGSKVRVVMAYLVPPHCLHIAC